MATPALPAYDFLFYQKTFTIAGPLTDVVMLKIGKAFWEKKVWLDGNLVGEHERNFTSGYFDLKPFVLGNGQTNTLVIRIGKQGTQPIGWSVGADLEKATYIPGIFDNVDLITTGNYCVVRVQTAPDIVNGKLRVLAHVANSSATSSNTPVTYEVREAVSNTVAGTKTTSVALGAKGEADADDIIPIANPHC